MARLVALGALLTMAPGGLLPSPFGGLLTGQMIGQAWADQKDKRLPALFAKLKMAPSPEAAAEIESQVWDIWVESHDPELDKLMVRGWAEMNAEDYDSALKDFSQLIDKKPDFAEAWNKRATLYYLMGDYEKSLADIAHTLKLEPRHFGALSGLGLVNIQLERYEDAVKAFERVLMFDPQDAGARHNLDAVKEIIKKKSI